MCAGPSFYVILSGVGGTKFVASGARILPTWNEMNNRLRARYALLRMMAMAYHGLQKWAKADSVNKEAMPYFEVIPALAPSYLSDYATMKLFQPQQDPSGAVALLDRYREVVGGFRVSEAGASSDKGKDVSTIPVVTSIDDEPVVVPHHDRLLVRVLTDRLS